MLVLYVLRPKVAARTAPTYFSLFVAPKMQQTETIYVSLFVATKVRETE